MNRGNGLDTGTEHIGFGQFLALMTSRFLLSVSPVFSTRSWIGCAMLTVALAARLELRAELSLVADLAGRSFTITEIRTGRLKGVAGREERFIGWDAEFRLEGDLIADARQVHWAPIYQIVLAPVRDSLPSAQRPLFGYVRLTNGPDFPGDTFNTLWPDWLNHPAFAVLGWLVDGKIRHLRVQRMLTNPSQKDFRLDELFRLSPAEAHGQAIVLIWRDGHFVPPLPWFRDARMHAALAQMLTGNDSGFGAALRNVNPRASGRTSDTLLNFAAEAGMGTAISRLLAAGARINTFPATTPLQAAAENGRLAIVEQLLAAGADPEKVNLQTVLYAGHDAVAARLLAAGPKTFRNDHAALFAAIENGFANIARTLMDRGATFPFRERGASQLLIEQAERGHTRMVELLLAEKVEPNYMQGGRTALGIAAMTGNLPLVTALLRGGANVNLGDASGATPLLLACSVNDVAMAEALIQAGADVTRRLNAGVSPLHYAALNNSLPLARQLREHGADLDAVGVGSERALDLALLAGARDTAQWLAAAGAKCDLAGKGAEPLLEAAIRLDVVEVVRDAVANGWTTDQPIAGRWPITWFAGKHQAERVLAWLATAGAAPVPPAPPAVLPPAALDAPLQKISAPVVTDPRDVNHRQTTEIVDVRVLVGEDGTVTCPHVDGTGGGRIALVALQHARGWRFSPPLAGGKPVATEVVVHVTFPAQPGPVDVAFTDSAPIGISRYRPRLFGMWIGPVLGKQGQQTFTLQGAVRVDFVVNPDGHATATRATTAAHPRNASAAMDAIQRWAFTVGIRDGVPVPTRMNFILD